MFDHTCDVHLQKNCKITIFQIIQTNVLTSTDTTDITPVSETFIFLKIITLYFQNIDWMMMTDVSWAEICPYCVLILDYLYIWSSVSFKKVYNSKFITHDPLYWKYCYGEMAWPFHNIQTVYERQQCQPFSNINNILIMLNHNLQYMIGKNDICKCYIITSKIAHILGTYRAIATR